MAWNRRYENWLMIPFFLRKFSRLLFLATLLGFLGKPLLHAENPFRDVPLDHFAYQSVEELLKDGIMQGYPDGTFKGKRVLTRYEFAVMIAKVLAQIEEAKEQGKKAIMSPDTSKLMDRLSLEFRSELEMLGVRIDTLEERIEKVEAKAKNLDETLSNVHISGYYEGSQTYVARTNKFTDFAEPGLHKMNQDVFLKFLGNPKGPDEKFDKGIEAFVELKANLSGVASQRLEYAFSSQPIPGDSVDDFATSILDERKIMVTKAHFKSSAPLMDLRIFAGEQFTDLRDPATLLSARAWRASPVNGLFSGVEASGKYKDWSYFTSALKRTNQFGSPGGDLDDLFSSFSKIRESSDDVFSFRSTLNPIGSVTLGASMVEHAYNYTTRNDFNRVFGWDANYKTEGDSTFSLTLNHLLSEGRGDVHDTGFKTDAQFEKKKLLLTFKHYDFGADFDSSVSAPQLIDTDGDNYGRSGTTGEKLMRLDAKYSFKEGDLAYLNYLNTNLIGQVKWWEDLPGSENLPWYGRQGTKISLFTVADFHREPVMFMGELTEMPFQLQLTNEFKKDAREGELGYVFHKLAGGAKVLPFLGFRGFAQWEVDHDRVELGAKFNRLTTALEMIGGLHKRLLYKNRIVDRIDYNSRPNEIDVNIWYTEWTWDMLKEHALGDATLKLFYQNFKVNVAAFRFASFIENAWVGQLNWNFSKKLEARTLYQWRHRTNLDLVGDDFWNWFGEIKYEPTPSTQISLSYGDDYSNVKEFEYENTRQRLTLKASTDF